MGSRDNTFQFHKGTIKTVYDEEGREEYLISIP